jgi:hypothetical protein
MGKIILLCKTFELLPKGNWLTILQSEQYVVCITITYLRSLAFKVDEPTQFSYVPNQDMLLWVNDMTDFHS